MRRFPLVSALSPALLVLGLATTACKKDKAEDPQPTGTQNRMSYTYSGATQNLTGSSISAIWDATSKTLYIAGTLTGQHLVVVNAINVTGPGTYPLTRNTNTLSNYGAFSLLNSGGAPTATWQSQRGPASPAAGSIVITKFDEANEVAEGTFTFTAAAAAFQAGTATGTAAVSGGSFGAYSFF